MKVLKIQRLFPNESYSLDTVGEASSDYIATFCGADFI